MYIPEGFGTVFPYIFANSAAAYIEFLKNALGAQELNRTQTPEGRIANSIIKIGTTSFMVSEASDQFPASRSAFYIYVDDADAAYEKAIQCGGIKIFEPIDMPYGDRQSGVVDPCGNIWWISKRLAHKPYY
jgi:PhnB protein